MKKLILTFSVIFFLSLPVKALAAPWVGIGNGGKFDASSISIGGRSQKWGFNISFTLKADYAEEDIFDYRTPHNDYVTIAENAYIGSPIGLDIFRFFNLTKNQAVLVGAGIYLTTQCDVAQSNATGWLYCQAEKDVTIGSASLGYQVNIIKASTIIAYHTSRGAEIMLGYKF